MIRFIKIGFVAVVALAATWHLLPSLFMLHSDGGVVTARVIGLTPDRSGYLTFRRPVEPATMLRRGEVVALVTLPYQGPSLERFDEEIAALRQLTRALDNRLGLVDQRLEDQAGNGDGLDGLDQLDGDVNVPGVTAGASQPIADHANDVDLRSQIEVDLFTAEARLAGAQAERARVLARLDEAAGVPVSAPQEGQIWEVLRSDRAFVNAGQPIANMVSCRDVYVEASVPDRYLRRLETGSSARIRLVGEETRLSGTVQSIRTASATDFEQAVAVPGGMEPTRLRVAVQLDDTSMFTDRHVCDIGRRAEVEFVEAAGLLGPPGLWLGHRYAELRDRVRALFE